VSWSLPFSEPIVLPDGSELATLRDAYDHLNKFPKSEQDAEEQKAAAHCLIEAAEHGGAVAFARIGMLRAMKQQADRAPTLELVDLTMREVQQLKTDHVDPSSRDREASLSSPVRCLAMTPGAPLVRFGWESCPDTGRRGKQSRALNRHAGVRYVAQKAALGKAEVKAGRLKTRRLRLRRSFLL
jgi:hypothetical protein